MILIEVSEHERAVIDYQGVDLLELVHVVGRAGQSTGDGLSRQAARIGAEGLNQSLNAARLATAWRAGNNDP